MALKKKILAGTQVIKSWATSVFSPLNHTHPTYENSLNSYVNRISKLESIYNLMTKLNGPSTVDATHGTNSYGGLSVTSNDTATMYSRSLVAKSKDAYCRGSIILFIPRINFIAIDVASGYYTIGSWTASCGARSCTTWTVQATSSTTVWASSRSIQNLIINGESGNLTFGNGSYATWKSSSSGAGGDHNSHKSVVSGQMTDKGFYIQLACTSYGENDDYASALYSGPKSFPVAYHA